MTKKLSVIARALVMVLSAVDTAHADSGVKSCVWVADVPIPLWPPGLQCRRRGSKAKQPKRKAR